MRISGLRVEQFATSRRLRCSPNISFCVFASFVISLWAAGAGYLCPSAGIDATSKQARLWGKQTCQCSLPTLKSKQQPRNSAQSLGGRSKNYTSTSPTKRRRVRQQVLNDQDLQDLRDESVARLRYVWDHIEATYGQPQLSIGSSTQQDEDEIDLSRLDEEVGRSQYFQRTPSPSPTASSQSHSESDTESESHVTDSEADEGYDQMHQSYFRARREMLDREYRRRFPQVHLTDSEEDDGKDSEASGPEEEEQIAASSRSPTPCEGRADSDTETESVGVIEGSGGAVPIEPFKKEKTPQPRPTPVPPRPFHPSTMLRQFRSFMPSFSPAPPPSRPAFEDTAEPSRSPFVKAESLEPAEAIDISSDSDWDDAPLATPKKEEADQEQDDALKTPTRPRNAKEGGAPSTTKQLPMAKLGLDSSPVRRVSSHGKAENCSVQHQMTCGSSSPSRSNQKQTVKPEEPPASSSPFVSLKSLSIPSSPMKPVDGQPHRASPTKTRSEHIRSHAFLPPSAQKSGSWTSGSITSEQSSSRSSTYEAEDVSTASEDELARWDR